MELFNFLRSKKRGTSLKHEAFISSDNTKGVSFEKAEKLRAEFVNLMSQDKRSEKFNIAASMLLSKAYNESIDCYTHLLEKYPDAASQCQSQIGACYYFKRDYEKAIKYYLVARKNGADEGMMDDNVWEASEALFKTDKSTTIMLEYLDHFPEGNYRKKAKQIIFN